MLFSWICINLSIMKVSWYLKNISILEWFLKNHVTLQIEVMIEKINLPSQEGIMFF